MSAHVKTVKQIYVDLERGNVDAVVAACSANCRWTIPDFKGETGDALIGRAAIDEFVSALLAKVQIESIAPEAILVDREWVIAVGHYCATVRATGDRVATPWLHCWRLRDAMESAVGDSHRCLRVISFDDSYDTLSRLMRDRGFRTHAA